MQVTVGGYGETDRRWHAKVVERAVAVLNDDLANVGSDEQLELWADFDGGPGEVIRLIAKQTERDVLNTIVFKTGGWRTTDTALPSAVAQLRAVVSAMRPAVAPLRSGSDASISAFSVKRSTTVLPDLPGEHRTLAFSRDIDDGTFFAYVDALEHALASQRLGSVTGTAGGLLGWCVDLASQDMAECIKLAQTIADRHALGAGRVE